MKKYHKYKKHIKHSCLAIIAIAFLGIASQVIFSFARDYSDGISATALNSNGQNVSGSGDQETKRVDVTVKSVGEKHKPEEIKKPEEPKKPEEVKSSKETSIKAITTAPQVTVVSSGNNDASNNKDKNKNKDKDSDEKSIESNVGTRNEDKQDKKPIEAPNVVISSSIPEAKNIEYYAQAPNADHPVYLGSAKKEEEKNGEWRYNVDVANRLPNGRYAVSARVVTETGEYRTEKNNINVRVPQENIENNSNNITEDDVDSDRDGISDKEEIQRGINPDNPDSDSDGYSDGDEIKSGYDPLKYATVDNSDKIVFQSPKEKGDIKEEFSVNEVKLEKKSNNEDKKIKFSGKALPNRFVTIYIYSNDPIIVTVKTNANGDWSYDLDKELEDGDHEVYVAVTDNTGKITAKSSPLGFIKTAQAIEVIPMVSGSDGQIVPKTESPVANSIDRSIYFALGLIVVIMSLALILLGITVNRKNRNEGNN